jgi:NAD(P)-dependent dehydrogenase (short-subunit alcohol dehydrogenase family)
MELENKVVMISGASQGLGEALARRFAREGALLSLCARGRDALHAVRDDLRSGGGECIATSVDVANEGDVAAWVEATLAEFGRIDVLVNNASLLGPRVPIADYPLDDWERVVRVNLTGAFLCSRDVIPAMRESSGSIINVSSGVGDHGRPLWGAYSASKNGLEALSQMLAGELQDDGVRTNTVDPGSMRTVMRAAAYPDEDPQTLPLPEDVADVFVYLASDRSRGVSGQRFRAKEFEVARR